MSAPANAETPTPKAPASCPANVRETKIAFGYQPQADLATANTPPELWSLTKTNTALSVVNPMTESDANDIGKGDEFPTQVFPTSMDTSVALEKYVSSEFLAWLFCFTTGNATKTGTTPELVYAAQPSDPAVACIDLPAFTYAEQVRTPPDSVVDRAEVGMVIQDWTLTMESGPGRANCRVAANFVGTGMISAPSGITPWPAVETEHFLNAASATITVAGIDYVLNKTFISLELRWANNVRLDSGYYPGSGTDANGFAIRGRMEYGLRQVSLQFVARALKGSAEFQALIAQTTGSCHITLKGAALGSSFHGMDITIPKAVFSAVVNGDQDGIVTVQCTVTPLKGAGPLITLSATTGKDAIFGL
jgi:hypothetical protein